MHIFYISLTYLDEVSLHWVYVRWPTTKLQHSVKNILIKASAETKTKFKNLTDHLPLLSKVWHAAYFYYHKNEDFFYNYLKPNRLSSSFIIKCVTECSLLLSSEHNQPVYSSVYA